MGAACCKRLEPETSSPHLPFCEVVRRCARVICPVDPPQQKPVYRSRKYGLSDIVGPVVKKDSWSQTDPQPPPRLRRKQRRRSRSVEFLPYLLQREGATRGSMEDIPGQEDVLDFQMYFMDRLPKGSVDEGKEGLTDRKKEFLSGLLGEENNNIVHQTVDDSSKLESKPEENPLQKTPDPTGVKLAPTTEPADGAASSRRSSITESLREFESSLLEMLELEEESAQAGRVEDEEEVEVRMMVPLRKKDLPTLEEKDEEYVISPIEEEGPRRTFFVPEQYVEGPQEKIEDRQKEPTSTDDTHPNSESFSSNPFSKPSPKDKPPTITVEIVS